MPDLPAPTAAPTLAALPARRRRAVDRAVLEQELVALQHRTRELQRMTADEHRRRMYAVNLLDTVLDEHTVMADLLERTLRIARLISADPTCTDSVRRQATRIEKLVRKNAPQVLER